MAAGGRGRRWTELLAAEAMSPEEETAAGAHASRLLAAAAPVSVPDERRGSAKGVFFSQLNSNRTGGWVGTREHS